MKLPFGIGTVEDLYTNRLLTNPAVSRLYNDKRVITYIIGSNRCADL